jgi:intermediate peptidase
VLGLHAPSDWRRLTEGAISQCEALRLELRSATSTCATQAPRQLIALDGISNAVCSVIDVAELCRHVHASPAWRQAAEEAFEHLAGYIGELNADVGVYECLRRITEDPQVFAGLGEEDRRFAVALRAEYERDGIQLPDAARAELQALNAQATALETQIGHAITRASQTVACALPRASLAPLNPGLWQDALDQSRAPPGHALLPADPRVLNAVVRYCPNPAARQAAYRALHATPGALNLKALAQLATVRHTTSVKLGFKSYAHRICQGHMCSDPRDVVATLRQLAAGLRPAADAEAATLQALKRQAEGSQAEQAEGSATDVVLEQWDLPHYMGLARAEEEGSAEAASAQYLPLDQCVAGLATLCRALFGVAVEIGPAPEAESWADANHGDSSSSSSWGGLLRRANGNGGNSGGVTKMTLTHPEQGALGDIYLDLEPRADKYGHAAHFTVRCGCLNVAGESQRPVVALVMNFASSSSQGGGPVQLTHGELETLLHEFGHALHSLLSRTNYQHLSGTRAAADFVETPSQLLEHFAWAPAYLDAAGTPLPASLLASLHRGQKMHAALDGLHQVGHSNKTTSRK